MQKNSKFYALFQKQLRADFTYFKLNEDITVDFYIKHMDFLIINFPYFKDMSFVKEFFLINKRFRKAFVPKMDKFIDIAKYDPFRINDLFEEESDCNDTSDNVSTFDNVNASDNFSTYDNVNTFDNKDVDEIIKKLNECMNDNNINDSKNILSDSDSKSDDKSDSNSDNNADFSSTSSNTTSSNTTSSNTTSTNTTGSNTTSRNAKDCGNSIDHKNDNLNIIEFYFKKVNSDLFPNHFPKSDIFKINNLIEVYKCWSEIISSFLQIIDLTVFFPKLLEYSCRKIAFEDSESNIDILINLERFDDSCDSDTNNNAFNETNDMNTNTDVTTNTNNTNTDVTTNNNTNTNNTNTNDTKNTNNLDLDSSSEMEINPIALRFINTVSASLYASKDILFSLISSIYITNISRMRINSQIKPNRSRFMNLKNICSKNASVVHKIISSNSENRKEMQGVIIRQLQKCNNLLVELFIKSGLERGFIFNDDSNDWSDTFFDQNIIFLQEFILHANNQFFDKNDFRKIYEIINLIPSFEHTCFLNYKIDDLNLYTLFYIRILSFSKLPEIFKNNLENSNKFLESNSNNFSESNSNNFLESNLNYFIDLIFKYKNNTHLIISVCRILSKLENITTLKIYDDSCFIDKLFSTLIHFAASVYTGECSFYPLNCFLLQLYSSKIKKVKILNNTKNFEDLKRIINPFSDCSMEIPCFEGFNRFVIERMISKMGYPSIFEELN